MYTYYLLSTSLGKDQRAKRKYLWWGRYLTQFQMFQFVTMMAQAAYCYFRSPYPKYLSALLFWCESGKTVWVEPAIFVRMYKVCLRSPCTAGMYGFFGSAEVVILHAATPVARLRSWFVFA